MKSQSEVQSGDFKNIAVLMGGPSSEREVSLKSGRAISNALASRGYRVHDVVVEGHTLELPSGIDAAFIALHGEFGEDGQVQTLLTKAGIPYTGPDIESSRKAFDKRLTKEILVTHDILTPAYELLSRGEACSLPLPVVVKPPLQGSTIGIHRVFEESQWKDALADAFKYGDELLVESYIEGRELTVGIVGEDVFPVVEIQAPGGYYDFHAKYTKGESRYLVPAPIPEKLSNLCRDTAWRTFKAVGCRGLSRVDIRLTELGEPFVLEINTIPGFTETSLLPMAARAAGIEFADLCDRIIRSAML